MTSLALATPRRSAYFRRAPSHAQLLADQASTALIEITADRRVGFCNGAFRRLAFGKANAPFLGQPVDELFARSLLDRFMPLWQRSLAGESVRSLSRIRAADGRRVDLLIGFDPVRTGGGEIRSALGSGTDVGLLQRRERLRSNFVAAANHDLRNPLSSIRAAILLLEQATRARLTPPERDLLDIAGANCARMEQLLGDLLDAERLQSSDFPFPLGVALLEPLLRQAVAALGPVAQQRGIRLAFDLADPHLRAEVAPDRFIQAATNLLMNALQFSPPGSIVEVGLMRRDDHARIEISDQGPGVPESLRSLLFQRFARSEVQAQALHPGFGLGLAIARFIVSRMKGRLDYVSPPGKGATFFFELPSVDHA